MTRTFFARLLAIALILGIHSQLAAQQPAWLQQTIAQGQVDASSFRAYSAAMEAKILTELQAKQITVDPDFLKLLQADRELRDGTFAAIYPADARIFENLQQIWHELPAATFRKYRHLALGAAVLRREIGVGPISDPPGNFKYDMFKRWVQAAATANISPAEYLAGPKDKATPPISPEASTAIDAFKAKHAKPCDEIWADAMLRNELIATLAPLNIEAKAVPGLLLQWQIAKGIRPTQRSSAPSIAAYIQALAKKIETPLDLSAASDKKGKLIEWPMFPVAKAPWPVLMGLGLTWPLDESQYIFEKLQGRHGERRLHLYGPYRKAGDEMTVASLTEIPWASSAWPQQILTGGVCGTMSTLAAGSYISLGVPMFKTGQPGHGNLLSYRANPDGSFYARVEQSASADPTGTYCTWPLGDDAHGRTRFAECHMGLALSMNKGLDTWMQSRLALTVFRSMPPEQRLGQGRKILAASLRANPFNAEVWYTLADAAPDTKAQFQLLKQLPLIITGQVTLSQTDLKDVNDDLSDEKHDDGDRLKQEVQFRSLVRDVILVSHFSSPAKFTQPQRKELHAYLLSQSDQTSKSLSALTLCYELALKDLQQLTDQIHTECHAALIPGKTSAKSEKQAVASISQLGAVLPQEQLETIVLHQFAVFHKANAIASSKKGPKLRPLAEALSKELFALYKTSGRKKEARKLQQTIDSWLKS